MILCQLNNNRTPNAVANKMHRLLIILFQYYVIDHNSLLFQMPGLTKIAVTKARPVNRYYSKMMYQCSIHHVNLKRIPTARRAMHKKQSRQSIGPGFCIVYFNTACLYIMKTDMQTFLRKFGLGGIVGDPEFHTALGKNYPAGYKNEKNPLHFLFIFFVHLLYKVLKLFQAFYNCLVLFKHLHPLFNR